MIKLYYNALFNDHDMKKCSFFLPIILCFLFISNVRADIGSRDIFRVALSDNSVYYFVLGSRGKLKNSDLCYYMDNVTEAYKGEVESMIKEILVKYFRKGIPVSLHSELHFVNATKFKEFIGDDFLYLLKGEEYAFQSLEEIESIEFLDAFNGNYVGLIYSNGLSSADNAWINNPELDILFRKDFSECSFAIYGLKNKQTEQELERIKEVFSKIEGMNNETFLDELHEKNIILIGTCS